jgi:hypothetical protein
MFDVDFAKLLRNLADGRMVFAATEAIACGWQLTDVGL